MHKSLNDLFWEADESLRNMDKPSYNKKNWYHNFCLCMDALLKRGSEMKDGDVKRYDKLLEYWK